MKVDDQGNVLPEVFAVSDPEETLDAENCLYDACMVLSMFSIPFVLEGGTLLGFWRDKNFCEGDHRDIDITTFSFFLDREEQMISAMSALGFELCGKKCRSLFERRTEQLSFARNGTVVDLFFKEFKGQNVWWSVPGPIYKSVPAHFYLRVKPHTFILPCTGRELMVKIPYEIEDYLQCRYGDWRTKVPKSKYSGYVDDGAIVKEYDSI